MQKWEYRIHIETLSTDELNELGRQGWELVAAIKLNTEVHYYFKRPLEEEKGPGRFGSQ